MNDCQLFMESIIYFSDNVVDDNSSKNSLYHSVFKHRMAELNEFIERNPILIQTLTCEQKIFLYKNIEDLREKNEDFRSGEVLQKVSSCILNFLEKDASLGTSKSVPLQIVSDPESFEAFIRVTLEKNTAHIPQVAEVLLAIPAGLPLLNPALLTRFLLALAEMCPSLLLQNMKKLQITDPVLREQIADIILHKNPSLLCSYIQDLNLSKTLLERIARKVVYKVPLAFVLHIEKFHIENPSLLEEFAINLSKTEPGLLAENIMKFRIQNERVRRNLAVQIAEMFPEFLVYNIRNFELSSDPDIETILPKLAELDLDLITEYFKVPPSGVPGYAVEQVALLIAREHPTLLISCIRVFQLTNEVTLQSVFTELARSDPKYFLENFHKFDIRDLSFFKKVIINMAIAHPDFTFDNLEKFVRSPQELPQFLSVMLEGYIQFYLSLANKHNAFSLEDTEKFPGVWEKTVFTLANTNRYRNMAVSVYLAKTFCYMFIHSEHFKENMLRLNGGNLVAYKIRPSILPAKWMSECQEMDGDLSREIAIITQFLSKRKKEFCEASPSNLSVSLLHNFLLTVRTLDEAAFSSSKKIVLLSRIFSEPDSSNEEICQKLVLLNILCSKSAGVENVVWSSKKDLIRLLNESIKDGSLGNLDDIEDLPSAYANTFGSLRIPFALETYGACIKEICNEDPRLQDAFEWFAHSVLKGTFLSERYRTDKNPHLKYIEDRDPSLLEAWKEPLDFSALIAENSSVFAGGTERWEIVETDNYHDLLFSGTEVPGSCLRIDGEAVKNKCLLDYLMDGKVRILAFKNPGTGKIVFRTILRLLWDTENNRPVLFQDFIYPSINDPEMEKVLREACIAKAKDLNIPLLTSCGGEAEMYKGNATSFGSSCPYEYVDSAGGVTEGVYSIRHAQVLFFVEG